MQGLTTHKEIPKTLNIAEELAKLKQDIMKNTLEKKEQEPISGKKLGELLDIIEIHMQGRETIDIYTDKHQKIPTYTVSWSINGTSYKSLEVIYLGTIQYSYIIQSEDITIKKSDGENRSEIIVTTNKNDEEKHNIGEAYTILQEIEEYFTQLTKEPTHDTNE